MKYKNYLSIFTAITFKLFAVFPSDFYNFGNLQITKFEQNFSSTDLLKKLEEEIFLPTNGDSKEFLNDSEILDIKFSVSNLQDFQKQKPEPFTLILSDSLSDILEIIYSENNCAFRLLGNFDPNKNFRLLKKFILFLVNFNKNSEKIDHKKILEPNQSEDFKETSVISESCSEIFAQIYFFARDDFNLSKTDIKISNFRAFERKNLVAEFYDFSSTNSKIYFCSPFLNPEVYEMIAEKFFAYQKEVFENDPNYVNLIYLDALDCIFHSNFGSKFLPRFYSWSSFDVKFTFSGTEILQEKIHQILPEITSKNSLIFSIKRDFKWFFMELIRKNTGKLEFCDKNWIPDYKINLENAKITMDFLEFLRRNFLYQKEILDALDEFVNFSLIKNANFDGGIFQDGIFCILEEKKDVEKVQGKQNFSGFSGKIQIAKVSEDFSDFILNPFYFVSGDRNSYENSVNFAFNNAIIPVSQETKNELVKKISMKIAFGLDENEGVWFEVPDRFSKLSKNGQFEEVVKNFYRFLQDIQNLLKQNYVFDSKCLKSLAIFHNLYFTMSKLLNLDFSQGICGDFDLEILEQNIFLKGSGKFDFWKIGTVENNDFLDQKRITEVNFEVQTPDTVKIFVLDFLKLNKYFTEIMEYFFLVDNGVFMVHFHKFFANFPKQIGENFQFFKNGNYRLCLKGKKVVDLMDFFVLPADGRVVDGNIFKFEFVFENEGKKNVFQFPVLGKSKFLAKEESFSEEILTNAKDYLYRFFKCYRASILDKKAEFCKVCGLVEIANLAKNFTLDDFVLKVDGASVKFCINHQVWVLVNFDNPEMSFYSSLLPKKLVNEMLKKIYDNCEKIAFQATKFLQNPQNGAFFYKNACCIKILSILDEISQKF